MLTKSAFIVTGLLFHTATATFGYGGWGGDSHYSTPDNTDNKCSPDQTKGYDWKDLASGSFDNYGSNKFSKWSCRNSFGKRDLLTKRSFQSKCISANLDDEPSIGCDGEDHMSIDKYEVSSSEDADIECHYEMPDKTVCKEYHSCKSGGTVIQNSQCGGAKSVTFKPVESFKGKGCNIGVHSIGFNCGAPSSTAPVASKTESIPAYGSSSPPTYATTSSTSSEVEITTDTTPYTSPSSSKSDTSAESTSVTTTETAPIYGSTTDASLSYDTTSSAVSSTSETTSSTISSTSETASGGTTSSCVSGYGASCSTTSESTSSSATSRETSPVEGPASDSTSSTPSTTSTSETSAATDKTTSSPSVPVIGIPTYSSHGTGASIPATNTSLTYKVPAYTQSSSTTVKSSSTTAGVTSIESYSSYTTGTIYSTSCETLTSSGSITTLTKSYAISTTTARITSPGKESSPVGTSSVPASYSSNESGSASVSSYPVQSSFASAPSSTVQSSSPSAPAYSGPEPSSPALLPRCLNTWMYLTDCSSNSDSQCYCKHPDFINKVYGCLSSWSQSADNATNGVSYLMGLCAPYIPENPAIITGCPSTITPAAYKPAPATESLISTITPRSTITLQSTLTERITTATLPDKSSSTEVSPENSSHPGSTSTSTPAPAANIPCTTITYSHDITLPATYPSDGSTIPSSSITSAIITTITVPQVLITTHTITESGSTFTAPGLGYGVPSTTSRVTPTVIPAVSSAYGSVAFTKSATSSGTPSGIVAYEGAGSGRFGFKFGVGGLCLFVAVMGL